LNINIPDSDLRFIVTRIPKDVRDLMMKYPDLILAGGFIRATIAGEKVSDIDIMARSEEYGKRAAMELAVSRKARIHTTENAITVLAPPRIPVQFITRWTYLAIDHVVLSFDFTIAQAAIQFDAAKNKWIGLCSDMFYVDLAAKRLNYVCPKRVEDAGGSMIRVLKFLNRGYKIQALSLSKVIARLAFGVNGIDSIYTEDKLAHILAGLLREVDPLTVVDGFDIVDEHEVLEKPTVQPEPIVAVTPVGSIHEV